MLLLHPVPRSLDEVASEHLRAGARLHVLEITGLLVDAQSLAPAMKQEGWSMVRPENSARSALGAPAVRQRYQLRPPWKRVRAKLSL